MDRDFLIDEPNDSPKDALDWIVSIHDNTQYKFLMYMFLIFLFISSDVFIGRILSNFDGAVYMKTPTNWGVILQGIFLVLAMIIADLLIRGKII